MPTRFGLHRRRLLGWAAATCLGLTGCARPAAARPSRPVVRVGANVLAPFRDTLLAAWRSTDHRFDVDIDPKPQLSSLTQMERLYDVWQTPGDAATSAAHETVDLLPFLRARNFATDGPAKV